MVDTDYNTWLIEINSSPDMDYTTPVTEKLCKIALEDMMKVVIDKGFYGGKRYKKKVDTGL